MPFAIPLSTKSAANYSTAGTAEEAAITEIIWLTTKTNGKI